MADFVLDQGISKNRVHILHEWEDGDLVKPFSPLIPNRLRQIWKIENKFVIGYYGNMGRAHEFETILEAAKQLSSNVSILFLFVGNGYYRDYIEKISIKNNLNNIIFKPYQPAEALQESFSLANLHLISLQPHLEGLLVPSKLFTAMAAGRPTIFVGHEDGEIARILKKFDCGDAIKTGNSESLIRTILKYFHDPMLCEKIGKNARNAFENNFDKHIALRRWNGLLKSIN